MIIVQPQRILFDNATWLAILSAPRPSDPYFAWADQTGFAAYYVQGKFPAVFSFIAELSSGKSIDDLIGELDSASWLSVPTAYRTPICAEKVSRFITIRISVADYDNDLERIDALRTRAKLLMVAKTIERLQFGYPRGSDVGKRVGGGNAQLEGADAVASTNGTARVVPPALVMGVIEDFLPFAHPAVRDVTGRCTRVVALWDQSTFNKASSPWSLPMNFGYGREVAADALNTVMTKALRNGEIDERACYGDEFNVRLAGDAVRYARCTSHGASILGLAAGALPVMPRHNDPDNGLAYRKLLNCDPAAVAPVVAVQLPVEQTLVSSGRWLPVNALDALRYVRESARKIGVEKGCSNGAQVVVNLSYGALAGAHHGDGMLERAIDELCKADNGLAVVLAAGNGYTSDAHAARTKVHSGNVAQFSVFIPPDKSFDTFVEFWTSSDAEIKVNVEAPDDHSLSVDATKRQDLRTAGPLPQTFQVGLFFPAQAVQSPTKKLVMLAVGSTQITRRGTDAPSGIWKVAVENVGGESIDVNAWIERDDQLVGEVRAQWARFVEDGDTLMQDERPENSYISSANTFSNIATGSRTFVVGAMYADHTASKYSAAGATEKTGPHLSAVADITTALEGIRVNGSIGGTTVRMNGTSVAAPQATRFIASQLSPSCTASNYQSLLAGEREDARLGHVKI